MPQQFATIDIHEHSADSYEEIYDAFEWDLPETYNIAAEVIESHVGTGRTALRFEWQDGSSESYTFEEIHEQAGRLATWFRARGVTSGDRIGVALSQHPVTLIAHVATYKLGAAVVPMSVLFGSESVAHRLETADVTALVTNGTFVERLGDELDRIGTLVTVNESPHGTGYDAIQRETAHVMNAVETSPDDVSLILFTSGTTGDPKGVAHGHGVLAGILPGFELMNEFPDEEAVVYTPADWAWVAGSLDTAFPAWWGGSTVVGYESRGFDPKAVFEVLESHGVTHTFLTPTMLQLLSEEVPEPKANYEIALETIVTGGEPTSDAVFEWVSEAFSDVALNEHYGQTEADILLVNARSVMNDSKKGALGRPTPGHEVAVIDEEGTVLPDGEEGRIAVRTPDPVVTLGYWNAPAETDAAYIGEWWDTGDMGYRDADGVFWFVGREDELIISSGYRISPAQIERKLEEHSAVRSAVVFGVPDETRGEIVAAAIRVRDGSNDTAALRSELKELVRNDLAKYKYPRAFLFVDELPRTSTDKVDKQALIERCSGS
jgi:acetyl-CoA synthetase